jgi:branched-subunit amino acid ABC-type transport system permease component
MDTVLVNGFFVGLIYGLLGIGLVIGYRGSRVVNFAHGDTGMIAAMFFIDLRFGKQASAFAVDHGLLYTLPLAIGIAAAVGAATELVVVRPLRNAPRIQPLVGTVAVSALLLVFANQRWTDSVRYTEPLVPGDGIRVAGLQVSPQQILILVVTISLLVGLGALYRFTRFGLRLRAVAVDAYAAGLTGVDVNRTSMASWALAGAFAGLSAILIAPLVAFNTLSMVTLMIRGLAAALVGGLTNIWGAFLAGVLIAVIEGIIAFRSPISGITDVLVAAFVLLLMLTRPTGLFRSAY